MKKNLRITIINYRPTNLSQQVTHSFYNDEYESEMKKLASRYPNFVVETALTLLQPAIDATIIKARRYRSQKGRPSDASKNHAR